MCAKQSCPGKRRVTVFPRTSKFFTFTAFVTISVKNSLVSFYIHRTISNILAVVNQAGNIFPLVYSFAVFDQTVVIWSSLKLASNAFYTSICDRMSWFSETQKKPYLDRPLFKKEKSVILPLLAPIQLFLSLYRTAASLS